MRETGDDTGDDPLTTFTRERSAALGGPPWLAARRERAFAAFEAAALPTEDEEEWRYSRVSELDLDRFSPPPADGGPSDLGVPDDLKPVLDAVGERSAVAVVRDGRLSHVEMAAEAERAGLSIAPATEEVGRSWTAPRDAFGLLHDAFVPEVVRIVVPAGTALGPPVVVLSWTSADGAAAFPHLVVEVGEQAEATVVAHAGSAAGAASLSVPVVELDVAAAANLRYVSVQDLATDTWQVADLLSRTGRDATLKTHVVALGGHYARLWVDASLPGQGATTHIAGVYFGDGVQMHDFRSVQVHDAPRSASDLVLKGAVAGQARGVYTGVIRVERGAKGTEAFLTNRNLVLSEGARVESVPNLEIENENDLKQCGHAAATGPVDEDHMFYLESRGVPTEVAERLLVEGFFDDVIDRIPVAGLRDPLRAAVARKLAGVGPRAEAAR